MLNSSCSAAHLWMGAGVFALSVVGAIAPYPATAQITPDSTLGAESTRVTPGVLIRGGNGDRIDGGAARGSNLFHSFSSFNIDAGQRVYFANPAGIQNILTRVTGRTDSNIQGLLGVDGGANLFLLNPNGIIFGPDARLDISGSFTASTGDRLTLQDGSSFSATEIGGPSLLSVAVPLGVQYRATPPGAITNAGILSTGQNLRLSGGGVTSTGQLVAPAGQLLVEGVAGNVQVQQATAQTATLFASNNLISQNSQLQTAGNLTLRANNTVQIRDSVANPFVAYAGRNLTIQGNQGIDIFALSHPQTQIQSGGNLSLISNGTISGDAHFNSGGNFSMLTLQGNPGNFFSLNDPIIRSNGNVVFGNYTGAALKVEAAGTIEGRNIRITQPDCAAGSPGCAGGIPATDPDFFLLTTSPSVILRAGFPVTASNVPQIGVPTEPTDFTDGSTRQPRGSIQIGNIDTTVATGRAGSVLLSATGNITTGNISAFVISGGNGSGGDIILRSTQGSIDTTAGELIATASRGDANAPSQPFDGGNITLHAFRDVRISRIRSDVGAGGNGVAGDVTLRSDNGSIFIGGDARTTDNGINADSINSINRSSRIDRVNTITPYRGFSVIDISAPQGSVVLNRATVSTRNFGTRFAGDIIINARDITLDNSAVRSTGNFGRILVGRSNFSSPSISSHNIFLNSSTLDTSNRNITDPGNFDAGGIWINAVGLIHLNGGSQISTQAERRGSVEGRTRGNAGDITITTGDLDVGSRSNITARSNGEGNAGAIRILATGSVTISGEPGRFNATVVTDVADNGIGNGGSLDIEARSININNFAIVATSIIGGRGLNGSFAQAGDIRIRASDRITISDNSAIFSEVDGNSVGNGGRISVSAPTISLDGSSVNTQVRGGGRGQAGDIAISAPLLLHLQNGGQLSTVTSGQGNAGNITIRDGQNVIIEGSGNNVWSRKSFLQQGPFDSSGLFASVEPGASGVAGAITIYTARLTLRNRAVVSAQTRGNGLTGGNIAIRSNNPGGRDFLLLMQGNSLISARAEERAAGGNVLINDDTGYEFDSTTGRLNVIRSNIIPPTGFILANQDDNDIIATADKGRGGNIRINAFAIFGLEERRVLGNPRPDNFLSDIDASSGSGNNGTVELNTLNIDPTRGLGELPIEIVNTADLVADGCVGRNRAGVTSQGEFTRTGRGGLSPNPGDTLSGDSPSVPLADLPNQPPSRSVSIPDASQVRSLVEAQGLAANNRGSVSLVSSIGTSTAPNVERPAVCIGQ